MRLVRFLVKEYGVLKDLEIRFHHREDGVAGRSYSLDVMVGLNGSGKSTVLQALAAVFRNLEKSAPVPFVFELEYERTVESGQANVVVMNRAVGDDVRVGELSVSVDGRTTQWSNDFLPDAIIAFTTGSESMWRPASCFLTQRTAPNIPKNWPLLELTGWLSPPPGDGVADESFASRFRLVQNRELSIVALCGLLDSMSITDDVSAAALESVLTYAGMRRLVGFSLRLRVNSGLVTANELAIVELLGKHADRALALGADRLFVFSMGDEARERSKAILAAFSGAFNFYRTLSNMAGGFEEPDRPLLEVALFLVPNPSDREEVPLHLFEWLSDGEQSLVGRMCLLTLLRGQDALVLLDEPEVHFNDYWKRRMLDVLDHVLRGQRSHVLLTTHSSITLTDLLKEDIVVLQRTGAFTSDAENPSMSTFGADPAEVMIHLFGSEYAAGQRAVSTILHALRDRPPEEHEEQVRQLEQMLVDVSPGYWSYQIKSALKKLRA